MMHPLYVAAVVGKKIMSWAEVKSSSKKIKPLALIQT